MLMHRKQPSYKGNFIYSLTYAHLQWHFRMTLKKEYFFKLPNQSYRMLSTASPAFLMPLCVFTVNLPPKENKEERTKR